MAQIINTNNMSLNAQRNLTTSSNALATTIQRLSSGLRINSAKDDAAGLAISERFSTQIRGMNQAARNANDGISLAQTAEGALAEISNNLQRIRELAVQSRNATNSESDRQALDSEVQLLKAEVQRVAEQTNFNGTPLLNGSFANQAFQVGADQGQVINISQIANANIKDLGNWNRVDTPAGMDSVAAVKPGGTTTLTGAALPVPAPGNSVPGTSRLNLTGVDPAAAYSISIGGETINVPAAGGRSATTFAAALISEIKNAGVNGLSAVADGSNGVQLSNSSSAAFYVAPQIATGATYNFDLNSLDPELQHSFQVGGQTMTVAAATGRNMATFTAAVAAQITAGAATHSNLTGVTANGATSGTVAITNGTATVLELRSDRMLTQVSAAVGATDYGALIAGDLTINGVDIGAVTGAATATLGVDALVTAINDNADPLLANITASNVNGRLQLTDSTGATVLIGGTAPAKAGLLNATPVTTNGGGFVAGSFNVVGAKGTATINFPAAGGAGQRASDLVKAINNQSYNTGVTASLDASGTLRLASLSGNFSVGPSGTGTDEELLANTGLSAGVTGVMDPAQPPAATVGTGWVAGDAETGFASLDVTSATSADNALAAMDAALQSINAARADLGAIQNRFTSTIANLNTSAENLTAARSRIRDTDYALETAELTRTQILQQAGTAMLAQANQVPQNVLSLLK